MKRIIVVLGLVFLLAACGSKVKPEDLVDESYKKMEDLENYHIESEIKVMVDHESKSEETGTFKGQIDEAKDMAHVTETAESGDMEQELELYFEDGKQYVLDGDQWILVTEDVGDIRRAGTTYYSIMKAVRDFAEYGEPSTDDKYTLTYSGTAQEVFYAFEDVFSLSLTGFDMDEETDAEVYAEFDQKDLFLTHLEIEIHAENDMAKAMLYVDVEFTDINDSEIERPDDLDIE